MGDSLAVALGDELGVSVAVVGLADSFWLAEFVGVALSLALAFFGLLAFPFSVTCWNVVPLPPDSADPDSSSKPVSATAAMANAASVPTSMRFHGSWRDDRGAAAAVDPVDSPAGASTAVVTGCDVAAADAGVPGWATRVDQTVCTFARVVRSEAV